MERGHGSYLGSAWAKGQYPLHGVSRKWASFMEQRAGLRHVTWSSEDRQLWFNPDLLPTSTHKAPTGWDAYSRSSFQTDRLMDSRNVQPSELLWEGALCPSVSGLPNTGCSPGRQQPVREVRGLPSRLLSLSMISSLLLWSSEIAVN